MKKLLIILSLLISFAGSAQVRQQFGAVTDNIDSLYNHTGLHGQYVFALGRFNRFDGLGGVYVFDTTMAETEIPYLRFNVAGASGMWNMVSFISNASSSDTSIFSDPDFFVLDIISAPPAPALNAAYIVLPPGAGAWIGHDNNIATGDGSGWTYDTAQINDIAANAADNNLYVYTAAGWKALALTLLDGGNNYGNRSLSAGNKRNKGFYLKTNNLNRFYIDSAGRTFIYNVPNDPAADSVLTIVNGQVMRAAYSAGGGGGGTTDDETTTATASQTAFTFTAVPASYDDYIIFVWGVAATPVTDYTTSGNVVTLTTAMQAGALVRFKRIK